MQIRLPLTSDALPLYLQCRAIADDVCGAWCVTDIELYSQPDYSLDSLVADDIRFDELPESSKDVLAAHIEAHWHEQCQRGHNKRVLDQVRA